MRLNDTQTKMQTESYTDVNNFVDQPLKPLSRQAFGNVYWRVNGSVTNTLLYNNVNFNIRSGWGVKVSITTAAQKSRFLSPKAQNCLNCCTKTTN